jgi:hypothetical protein
MARPRAALLGASEGHPRPADPEDPRARRHRAGQGTRGSPRARGGSGVLDSRTPRHGNLADRGVAGRVTAAAGPGRDLPGLAPSRYNRSGHPVRPLVRSLRVRRALVWSLVPYLLLAVFADFLHVHPLVFPEPAMASEARQVVRTPSPHPPRTPDTTCAICQWHRVGSQHQAIASIAPAARPAPAPVISLTATEPESPVPHPRAHRGPPSPSFPSFTFTV